jgi:hypothetical protein
MLPRLRDGDPRDSAGRISREHSVVLADNEAAAHLRAPAITALTQSGDRHALGHRYGITAGFT